MSHYTVHGDVTLVCKAYIYIYIKQEVSEMSHYTVHGAATLVCKAYIYIYVVLNLYSLRIVYNAQHLMLSVYSAQYILHIIHNEQNSYTLYIMSNTVKLLIVYNAHRVSSFQGLFRLFRLLLTSRKCDRKQEMFSSIVRANLLSESTQSWILDESSLMKKLHV